MDAENQNFSKIPLSQAQLQQIINSPEGQALIRMLKRDGGSGVRAAAESLRRGDAQRAKEILSPLLQKGDGEDLAERLGDRL